MINLVKHSVVFRLTFQQSLSISLLTLIAVAVFIRLGFWQIKRAEEKQNLMTTMAQRMESPVIYLQSNSKVDMTQPEMLYRKIHLRGTFYPQHQIFLDNKKLRGKSGYDVITPFRLDNSQQYLLINRGWIPAGFNRSQLPQVQTPQTRVDIQGTLTTITAKGFRPGIEYPGKKLGTLWLYIDPQLMSAMAGYPLPPILLLQDTDPDSQLVARPLPILTNPEMHMAYTIQWFAFALFSLLAYVGFGLKKNGEDRR